MPNFAGVAAALRALTGWRRWALAAGLGAVTAFALAPYDLVPLLFLGFTGLVWLLDGAADFRRGFAVAFLFAYGYFVAGLWWLREPFFVDAERFAHLWPLAVFGLPVILAPFAALPIGLLRRYLWPAGPTRLLTLGIGWAIGETLRGHLFTGFPWNQIGYVWTVSDLTMQPAALIGVDGLGPLTVVLGALPALLARPGRGAARLAVAVVAGFALLWGWGGWRLATAQTGTVADVRVRLVQPGIDQRDKESGQNLTEIFRRHLALSHAPGTPPTLLVWPETAVPFLIEREPRAAQLIAEALAPGGYALVGGWRASPPGAVPFQIWNSLFAIDAGGQIVAAYDKHHLVPWGEFLPLRPLFSLIGLDKLSVGATDQSFGEGPGVIALPGFEPFRVLICYEAIFPTEIALPGDPRPGLIVNITNDGWFGRSAGPYQHLAMTRMRAVEQGVPVVRAANTGISAIIDSYGRVLDQLALNQTGVVDGRLPLPLKDNTAYRIIGKFGEITILLIMALIVFRNRLTMPDLE